MPVLQKFRFPPRDAGFDNHPYPLPRGSSPRALLEAAAGGLVPSCSTPPGLSLDLLAVRFRAWGEGSPTGFVQPHTMCLTQSLRTTNLSTRELLFFDATRRAGTWLVVFSALGRRQASSLPPLLSPFRYFSCSFLSSSGGNRPDISTRSLRSSFLLPLRVISFVGIILSPTCMCLQEQRSSEAE